MYQLRLEVTSDGKVWATVFDDEGTGGHEWVEWIGIPLDRLERHELARLARLVANSDRVAIEALWHET